MRIAGIDIGGTSVKLGVFDTEKGLLNTEKIMTGDADPEKMVAGIAEFVNRSDVELCGAGSAGVVDTVNGLVRADNLRWKDVPLRDMLVKATGKRVWIDNDANAALMAEWYDGACKGATNALQITLGTGVGGAALINGKPWRGHANTACEFGHLITHADGLRCSCTQRGCFEMYASAGALLRCTGAETVRQVMDGLAGGDKAIREGFAVYTHELCVGMISLIMAFNPQVFVIGGGLAALGDDLLTPVREEIYEAFRERPNTFHGEIRLAKHGNDAGMIGAALLARELIHKLD